VTRPSYIIAASVNSPRARGSPFINLEPVRARPQVDKPVELRFLADGGNDRRSLDIKFRTSLGHRPWPPGGVGRSKLHADAPGSNGDAILEQDLHGRRQEFNLHALFQRPFDLRFNGRHLGAGTAIQKRDLGSQSPADAGGVDGCVSPANHQDLAPDLHFLATVCLIEKFSSREYVGSVLARHSKFQTFMGADAHKYGTVVAAELLD